MDPHNKHWHAKNARRKVRSARNKRAKISMASQQKSVVAKAKAEQEYFAKKRYPLSRRIIVKIKLVALKALSFVKKYGKTKTKKDSGNE